MFGKLEDCVNATDSVNGGKLSYLDVYVVKFCYFGDSSDFEPSTNQRKRG